MDQAPDHGHTPAAVSSGLEARARAQLEALQQQHAQAYAELAASPGWQRLIALEAAIGTLQQLIEPPAEAVPPPATSAA